MGRENMIKMAEKGIVWVPTVFTMKVLSGMYTPGSNEFDSAEKYLDHQLNQIIKAIDLGVIIAIGTDSGSPGILHGESIFEEMKLFHLAGLSAEKTIQCATGNGALLFGLDEKIGKILPGFAANFTVIKERPVNLFSKTITPKVVIVNGSVYSKEYSKEAK
jgi:imidazolonepropionase-like amidohydrolase